MTGRPYLLPPINEVCEVVFLHLSVSHSVHGEGGMHPGGSAYRRVCVPGGLHPERSAFRGIGQMPPPLDTMA